MKRLFYPLVLFAIFSVACQEQTKEEIFLQGVEFVNNGNHQAAVTLFKKALEKDPNYIDARLQLGFAYLETGKHDKAEKELEKALLQDPGNVTAILKLSEVYLDRNNPRKAIDQLTKLLASDSNNAEALFLLARCNVLIGDLKLAEKQVRESLVKKPNNTPAQLFLAGLLLSINKDDQAFQLIDQVLEEDPANTNAYYLLTRKALSDRDRNSAIKALETIKSINADDINANYLLGVLYLDAGQIDSAQQIASELIRKKPNHPAGYRIDGISLYQSGNFEMAIQRLKKSNKGMNDLAGYYFVGLANYRLGQFEQALSDFQKALDKSPSHDQSRLMLAQVLYKQGRIEDCIRQATQIIDRNPENANAHNILASAYMVQGNYDMAMEYIDKAVQINPDLAQAHLKKGLFNIALGNDKQVELDLTNAVNTAPETLNTRILLTIYYIRKNNYPMATQVIEKGLTITPDSPVLYNLLAAVNFGQNKPEEAIEALNKAKKYKPDYFQPYFNIAKYYISRNNYQAALAEYQAVMQVDPTYVPAMLNAATVYELLKQDDKAESLYQKAIKLLDSKGYIALASFQQRQGKRDIALQTLEKGYASNPDNIDLLIAYAKFLKDAGKYDEAIQLYIQLEKIRPGSGKFLLLQTYVLMKDFVAAKEIADHELSENPSSAAGYLFLSAVYEEQSEWQLAENTIQRGITKVDNDFSLRMKMASLYLKRDAYEEALKVYDEILVDKPGAVPVLFAKARLYDLIGEKKQAFNLYEKILGINENHVPTLNNLAILLVEVYADNKRALELAAKGFQLQPSDPRIIDTLGYVLLKNDQTDDAIVFLEKASSLAPDIAPIQIHLAQAYKAAGRYDEAIASLASIREKGASETELKTAEALLKELN